MGSFSSIATFFVPNFFAINNRELTTTGSAVNRILESGPVNKKIELVIWLFVSCLIVY